MPVVLNKNGFTLLELMIVLAIMGGIVALSMPYISNRNSQIKATLREFTVLSRELHTKAKLQGVVYRLVIDLQEPGSQDSKPQTYWVEKANGNTVLKPDEEADALERAAETDPEKKGDPRGFEADPITMKTPRALPSGLSIEKVELARLSTPIVSGKAFIHYMPQGLVDEAAIQFKGAEKQAWTVSIHPLTGRGELIQKSITLKEINSQ